MPYPLSCFHWGLALCIDTEIKKKKHFQRNEGNGGKMGHRQRGGKYGSMQSCLIHYLLYNMYFTLTSSVERTWHYMVLCSININWTKMGINKGYTLPKLPLSIDVFFIQHNTLLSCTLNSALFPVSISLILYLHKQWRNIYSVKSIELQNESMQNYNTLRIIL